MNQIREVSESGIQYEGEDHKLHFIDFETCWQNFLSFREKAMAGQYTEDLKRIDRQFRTVGYRKFSAKPSYIELYTSPPIRFEFPVSGKFEELAYRIRKAGYHLTDGD